MHQWSYLIKIACSVNYAYLGHKLGFVMQGSNDSLILKCVFNLNWVNCGVEFVIGLNMDVM